MAFGDPNPKLQGAASPVELGLKNGSGIAIIQLQNMVVWSALDQMALVVLERSLAKHATLDFALVSFTSYTNEIIFWHFPL